MRKTAATLATLPNHGQGRLKKKIRATGPPALPTRPARGATATTHSGGAIAADGDFIARTQAEFIELLAGKFDIHELPVIEAHAEGGH